MKTFWYSIAKLVLLALLLAGCAGQAGIEEPTARPEATQERSMISGPVYLDVTELRLTEEAPFELSLHLEGNLPTPCHSLKSQISGPDQAGNIEVELWSEAQLGQDCIQVLAPIEQDIALTTVEQGSYTVFVNGEAVGQVDA